MDNNLTFLESAKYILKNHGRPLSSKSIAKIGLEQGILKSTGETPWKTFNSKISADILKNGEESNFMRVAEGAFALRLWKNKYPEYFAKRHIKRLYDEDIAVFQKKNLELLIKNKGLSTDKKDYIDLIRSIIFPMKRSEAEQNFNVIQLVSVFLVVYEGKILTHMRSKRLPESRLHGEYSLMLGGHLSMDDFMQLELSFSTMNSGLAEGILLRELSEELVLETQPDINRVGLLYDTSREVSKQHIGLVYTVRIYEDKFDIGERGFLMNAKFEELESITDRYQDFENWSWIILNERKKIGILS